MEDAIIDFDKTWNSEVFPSDKFLDWEVFRAECNELTTKEEKVDITGTNTHL